MHSIGSARVPVLALSPTLRSRAPVLKSRPEEPLGAVEPSSHPSPIDDAGKVIACARCQSYVTTSAARIEMDGKHEHRFVNPHGLLFRIGCFCAAEGCLPTGESSTFWSWFPGFAWQVDLCGSCGEHLGWLFSNAASTFHGLILDRLVEIRGAA